MRYEINSETGVVTEYPDAVIDPTGALTGVLELNCRGAYNLIKDSSGNIWVSGNLNPGYVHKFTSSGVLICTIATDAGSIGLAEISGYIWVANFQANTIQKIDMATNAVVDSLATGSGPYGLCYTGGYLYAGIQYADQVIKIDPATKTIVATLDIGIAPHNIITNGTHLYIANENSHDVNRINLGTFTSDQTLSTGTGRMVTPCIDSLGRVWVTGYADGSIYVFDNGSLVHTISGNNCFGLAFDGTYMWASHGTSPGVIYRYDMSYNEKYTTIPGANQLRNIMLDGTTLWMCGYEGNKIYKASTI